MLLHSFRPASSLRSHAKAASGAVKIGAVKIGAVKIYAQNCLQTPADLKSAGNRGVVQSRLQVLHIHVFLAAPLRPCHVA